MHVFNINMYLIDIFPIRKCKIILIYNDFINIENLNVHIQNFGITFKSILILIPQVWNPEEGKSGNMEG